MKIYSDLNDWRYYQDQPNEIIEEAKDIVTEKLILRKLEMKIINSIKYKNPESISELARKIQEDVKIIRPKLKELEREGLIHFRKGPTRRLKPVLNFDKVIITF